MAPAGISPSTASARRLPSCEAEKHAAGLFHPADFGGFKIGGHPNHLPDYPGIRVKKIVKKYS